MAEDEEPSAKTGQLIGRPGQPLEFQALEDADPSDVAGISFPAAISKTLREYMIASQTLLEGTYAGQKDLAPPHMRIPCTILVVRCDDGILVRYDKLMEGAPKVRYGVINQTLMDLVPLLSENVVHLPDDPSTYQPSQKGPEMVLQTIDNTGNHQEVGRVRPLIYATRAFPDDFEIPPPPARPVCLLSIHNEFDMHMQGFVAPADKPKPSAGPDIEQFILHSRFRLPVGWEAIEVYPLLDDEYWKPELAAGWAEIDLLAAIARKNLHGATLNGLDNRGASRKLYASLLDELEALLDGPEEPVHQFLKLHPELLCPTNEFYWSKLPFGDRVSDFVFREPFNDYLLVEIEAPSRKLFRKDGQPRAELTHAIDQISDWVQYIGDNKQKVEEEQELVGISPNPRCLVVIGRSQSLSDENRSKLVTIQAQQGKLRILTYDDLIANARANLERLFGPLGIVAQNAELYYFK